MYIIKIGNLYLRYLSIENYDNNMEISFTNEIEDAKLIKPENLFIYDTIIKNSMLIENIESIIKIEKEENENK